MLLAGMGISVFLSPKFFLKDVRKLDGILNLLPLELFPSISEKKPGASLTFILLLTLIYAG